MKTCSKHLTIIGTAIVGALCHPALAQNREAQNALDNPVLADIVVTAQRREESLQNVPVAVTALTSEALDQARVTTMQKLGGYAPNLQISSQGRQSVPTINIRGVTSGGSNNGTDPRVGTYVDGVYIGRSLGSLFDVADIARVEVLRGPQGTLFGRNATGGALSLTTAAPTGEWGVKALGSYGNYDAFRGKITVNFPAMGPFSFRMSYLHDQIDGDVKNLLGGRTLDLRGRDSSLGVLRFADKLGSRNVDGGQVAVRGEFGALTADYRFDYTDSHSVSRAFQNFGVTPNQQGQIFAGVLAFQPALGGVTNFGTSGPLDTVANGSSDEHIVTQGHSLTLTLTANDHLTVKSITAYRKMRQDPSAFDIGASGGVRFTSTQFGILLSPTLTPAQKQALVLSPANAPDVNDSFYSVLSGSSASQRQFTQELQLQLTHDHWDLTTGLFYFHERAPAITNNGVLQPVTNGVVIPNPSLDALFGSGVNESVAVNDSMAGYGQLTLHLTDKFDLTGGVRYTIDDRHMNITSVSKPSSSLQPGRYSLSYNKWSYTAIATYRPTDEITTYAKVAEGYVAGGIYNGYSYQPETLKSYEIGLKSKLWNGRIRANLAAFYNDYRDLQVNDIQAGLSITTNAGKAKVKGVEAELEMVPFRSLTLGGNVGYTDFKYDEYCLGNTFIAGLSKPNNCPAGKLNVAEVASPVYMSKWTLRVNGQYDTPELPMGGNGYIRVDARYRSKAPLTGVPITDTVGNLSPLNAYRYFQGFWVVDGRIGIADLPLGNSKIDIAAYGENLFNTRRDTFGASVFTFTGTYERGRTYGIEAGFQF